MATTAFTAWLPEVLPNVPSCPEVLAVNAVRNSCIEFCSATCWWQGDYGTTAITTAQLPFDFTVANDASVTQILVATFDGLPLAITNIDELDSKVVGWRDATGQPRAVFQPTPGMADFYPRPAGTDSYDIFMRVAYTPLRAATSVDSTVYEAYLEEIAAGALARLLTMPGAPWANEKAGGVYDDVFKSAKVQANIEASRSYGRGAKQIQMRAG
jgi:hypothetical protein